MNMVLLQTLMMQAGNSIMICWKNWFFYIKQNIHLLILVTFDFGFKIFRDLTKPGHFFWTHTSAFVNVALSYESDWLASVNEPK